MSSQNENNSDLKKEILEFGFEEEMVELAMKLSKDKEEICNIIVKMMEDPEFYSQIKTNSSISEKNKQNFNYNLSNFIQNISNFEQYKMIILVRKDLNMSIGKTAAQVAHASLGAYKKSINFLFLNY